MTNGKWQIANGDPEKSLRDLGARPEKSLRDLGAGWQMANGRWQVADGK